MPKGILRRLTLAAVLCLPFVWLSCSSGPSGVAVIEVGNPKPELSGRVFDKQTNLPVANALVSIWDTTFNTSVPHKVLITDANGYYSYDSLPTDMYNLTFSKDTKRGLRDTLFIDSTDSIEISDTVDYVGSISGTVQMRYGDAPDRVSIIVQQTHKTYLVDNSGTFSLDSLAKGRYNVRFTCDLDIYSTLDTVFEVSGGQNLIVSSPIILPFRGIPRVEGVSVAWDTLLLTARISWLPLDSSTIGGYNIYRSIAGQLPGSQPLASVTSGQTTYSDATPDIGHTYSYYVKAINNNINTGEYLSIAANISTFQSYNIVRSFSTGTLRTSNDFSPIVAKNGHIYCINTAFGTPALSIFDDIDTIGTTLELSSLVMPWNLKIYDSLFYIGDYADNQYPVEGEKATGVIKRFSLNGTFIDTISIKRPIENLAAPYSGADFIKGQSNDLFFTNSTMAIRYRLNGTIAASRYPSDVLLSFVTRLGSCKGSIVAVSGYKTFSQDYAFCQISLLDTAKLTVKSKVDFPWWCQGFAVDEASGLIYVVADKSTVYVLSENLTIQAKFRVPESLYYDIAVDDKDGSVVLFDGKSVVRYKRNE